MAVRSLLRRKREDRKRVREVAVGVERRDGLVDLFGGIRGALGSDEIYFLCLRVESHGACVRTRGRRLGKLVGVRIYLVVDDKVRIDPVGSIDLVRRRVVDDAIVTAPNLQGSDNLAGIGIYHRHRGILYSTHNENILV